MNRTFLHHIKRSNISQILSRLLRLSFLSCSSACAQHARRTHRVRGSGPQRRGASETDASPLIHSWQDKRPFQLLPDTQIQQTWELEAARLSSYLPGRSLLLSPGVCPCFRYDAAYVWRLSLSRKDCCCILQQERRDWAPVADVCCSVGGLSVLGSARHQTGRTGPGRTRSSELSARRRSWDARRLLLGRTGTPCSHFTPDAAPPLSLCFPHTSPTAPPTRFCAQFHVPAEMVVCTSQYGQS